MLFTRRIGLDAQLGLPAADDYLPKSACFSPSIDSNFRDHTGLEKF